MRRRFYGDVARAYVNRNDDLQEPGRAQLGAELYLPFPAGSAWDTYVAVDLDAWEERDWAVDVSAQVGVRQKEGAWRFAVGRVSGRTPIAEFFFHDETYLAIGTWHDLGVWAEASPDGG